MPKVGELRYTTNHKNAQATLDRANDLFLALNVGFMDQSYNPDRLFEALMAAWDYITDTTSQEVYNG